LSEGQEGDILKKIRFTTFYNMEAWVEMMITSMQNLLLKKSSIGPDEISSKIPM